MDLKRDPVLVPRPLLESPGKSHTWEVPLPPSWNTFYPVTSSWDICSLFLGNPGYFTSVSLWLQHVSELPILGPKKTD